MQTITTAYRRLPAAQAGDRGSLASGYRASNVIATLLTIAAGAGLVLRGLYNDTAFAVSAFRGTDLVTVAVVLPLFLGSLHLARRRSERARLLWLGALGYVVYTYLYTFAIAFNELFLLYVALLSLSIYTLVRALIATDAEGIAARFDHHAPIRGVGTFLWIVGGMLGLIELAQVVPAQLTGEVPDLILDTGHPTGVVYILDLGAVVPLMLLSGLWLRRGRPWGYVTAPILLVKGVTVGLALCASNLFSYLDRGTSDGALIGLWIAIAAGSAVALERLLRHMRRTEALG